ncbi:MAG: PKD domain-containing protein [Rhodanobacteraceae bacterium]|nr:PKD domain-containing protein [Rhodanobacteraceae bacterium]
MKLTVTDNAGASHSVTKSVSLTAPANVPPTAGFSFTTNGLIATFTDGSSDSDGSIIARSWDFGDGTSSAAASPVKTFATAGTYSVKLTVTDNGGATNTTTKSVTVSTTSSLPECPTARTDQLGKNCARSNLSQTAGSRIYFFVYIPPGAAQLRIRSSGGSGNADLYYHPNYWATDYQYVLRSNGPSNDEEIVVANPPSGYLYITLHAQTSFSGARVTTEF